MSRLLWLVGGFLLGLWLHDEFLRLTGQVEVFD